MPPAAIAVGGALYSGYQQKRAADKQHAAGQQAAAMMSPQAIMQGARTLNPFLFRALGYSGMGGPISGQPLGSRGGLLGALAGRVAEQMPWRQGGGFGQPGWQQSGFQNALTNIVQDPGYIDPSLMNMNLIQSMRQGQQGLLGAQGMLGRTGMQGGLADAYALANRGATVGRNMGILQNYNLAREQQRRQDIQFVMNELARSQQLAGGLAGQQAGLTAGTPPSGMMPWGDIASAGLGAYGAFQGMRGQQQQPTYQPGLVSPVNPTGKQFWPNPFSQSQPYQPPFQSQGPLFATPQVQPISPVFGRNTNLFGTQRYGQGTR